MAALAYFAGERNAERRHKRERQDEADRELRLEKCATADKLIDEFVSSVRRHYADGPYALALLGLETLGSDAAIRDAIEMMRVRSGSDPWSGQSGHVKDVDLVGFFRYVRENRVNFANTSVEDVAKAVRRGGKDTA